MPTTEHIHLPLYTDEETPDLSTTGHYNHAMEIIDANVGELEKKDAELAENIADEREARIAGDSALDAKLAAETKARTDADTALDTAYKAADTALGKRIDAETAAREAADTTLGSRIDNAETEISANSADLTGIKGLTYGRHHINFLESHNGEYTSPALEEIAEQIAQGMAYIQIPDNLATLGADSLDKLRSDWPNVALVETTNISSGVGYNILVPLITHDSEYVFSPISGSYSDNGVPYNHFTKISVTGDITREDMSHSPYWANIINKPFSTIGSGLKVVSDALTVDTAAIPTGITANTTFGDLTAGVTS